jgi:hypothetical protein
MKSAESKNAKKSPYVRGDDPALQKVVRVLRSFVKSAVPDARETVNSWGVPTFEKENPCCLYMVGKNHVTLGFHYGTSLKDPERLLEGTGKNIRHVRLRASEDLERKGLRELVLEASRLEGKTPMKGMSGKRKPPRK